MTQTAADAPPASSPNGHAPAATPGAAEEPCTDCTPASERVMGVLGLLFAAALGVIALDLLTGGALSRAAGLGAPEGEAGSDGAGA